MYRIEVNRVLVCSQCPLMYYNGECRVSSNPNVYVTFAGLVEDEKCAKAYRFRWQAERVARKLEKICGNVYSADVAEVSE